LLKPSHNISAVTIAASIRFATSPGRRGEVKKSARWAFSATEQSGIGGCERCETPAQLDASSFPKTHDRR
jgi:hypothetical protein